MPNTGGESPAPADGEPSTRNPETKAQAAETTPVAETKASAVNESTARADSETSGSDELTPIMESKVTAASGPTVQVTASGEAPVDGTPVKKDERPSPTLKWGDIKDDEDAATAEESSSGGGKAEEDTGLDLTKATISEEGTVDKPEMAIKAEKLNESVEAAETVIEKVIVNETPYSSAKTFEDLNLPDSLLRGLYSEMKFEKPSRIQAETLPMILTPPFANLIAQAHNGSGKTTCFALGMLGRVDPNVKAPQALCVCPTRELVIQNVEVLTKMGKYTGITCASTTDDDRNYSASRRGKLADQVVIGTPGTLKRWMTRDRILETRNIRILVFDEADHMLDQDGFQDDSVRIIREVNKSSRQLQILLFSATFSEKVKQFVTRTIPNANKVFVPKEELSLDVIKQYRVVCPSRDSKLEVLQERIFPIAEKLGQSIIFVKTRESARELHRRLDEAGHKCTSIQGGMEHSERDRVIREFRSGETKILISTDVLARGFDQAQVTLVVNYDIPVSAKYPHEPEYELYLHRIGRSGRFGRKGAAFNLVVYGDKDVMNLNKIEHHFNKQIPELAWDDDDAFETALKDAGLA
eukprot:TRINITY_DN4539_c3_g1_i1.p1 TRINITY_DN4539_c3_g1~~TRINITY_DN4539_c3_g1_i1.p1  ORF type:complete len:583 (-),score=121.20 TRINITY_DN4539_c3_g1_i1:63-1811(-)